MIGAEQHLPESQRLITVVNSSRLLTTITR